MFEQLKTFLIILVYFNILCNGNSNITEVHSALPKVKRDLFNIIKEPFVRVIKSGEETVSWVANAIPTLMTYLIKPFTNVPLLLSKKLSLVFIEEIVDEYTKGTKIEDVHLEITELIHKYNHPIESHAVQTKDGYILNMHRIPAEGPVVFLMHGLLSSSDDWVTAGPESSIAILLASEGYDVWMGNARGNKHSRRHTKLSPEDPKFWDFSWDEIGHSDLPAMIDYVLHVTGEKKLKYVGHSQGTTSFFVMCSEKPEYNDKISLMVALSPIAWMSHLKSPIVRFLSPVNPFLFTTLKSFGLHEFLPPNMIIKTLQITLCGNQYVAELLCSNIVFLICGFDYSQLNVTNLPVLFSHVPSGAATKQIVHYGQEVVSGKFRKFDYGEKLNLAKYKTKEPPSYQVERITAAVALFYSVDDWLASVEDVEILHRTLKNVVEYYKVPYSKFNHLDFIWAKDVKKLIFDKLLTLLRKF